MKNRNVPKPKYIPRWILVGLNKRLFTSTEIAREMRVRGCKMPETSFSQKSKVGYTWSFSTEELQVLKVVKKLIISSKIQELEKL